MDLIKIYNELLQSDDCERVIDELKENNINGYCFSLLDKTNFDDTDKNNLLFIIRILQYIYNNSSCNSPVSDDVFDSLYELNKKVNLTEVVGSTNPQGKIVANHNYPDLRGTLDKVHFFYEEDKGMERNKVSIEHWFLQVINKWMKENLTPIRTSGKRNIDFDILMMPKFDGVSIIIETDENHVCERALTRGDTERNEAIDLSHIFKGVDFSYLCKKYNIRGKCGIKLEVIMTYDNYKAYCEKYGKFNNPRAAVISATGNNENGPEVLKYLTMQPLRIQDETGTITCVYDYSFTLTHLTEFPEMIEKFQNVSKEIIANMGKLQIPIDGIVFVILNKDIQNVLGRKDAINKYEFAYKFPTNRFRTKVLDVEWSVGNLGNITPVACLDPMICYGNRVDSATLSNIDKFKELDLSEEDEVIIIYDIVPYLIKDGTCKKSGKDKFKIPKKCPICNGETYFSGAFLKCGNKNCQSKNIGSVLNYVEKMRIPNLNTETVNKFFKEKILFDIRDIYNLKNYKRRITELPGFGLKSFENIIKGIDSRRTCTTADMLGSIGIESIAKATFKKILSIYNLSDLVKICEEHRIDELTDIDGIGESKAEKVIYGINEKKEIIMFLQKELVLSDQKSELSVTFTGFRDKDFEEFLRDKGVEVSDGFKKSLDIVVVNDLTKELQLPEVERSKKYLKAIKNNIKVMDKIEFAELYNYKGIL